MVLIPVKSIKKGQKVYTRIGKYMDEVIIVSVHNVKRASHGGKPFGKIHSHRMAKVRRVGSSKVLPKMRHRHELYKRKSARDID